MKVEEKNMNQMIDLSLFNQRRFDSGAIGPLVAILHNFADPGEYRGVATRGGERSIFYLTVESNHAASQVNIDLASLGPARATGAQPCCDCAKTDGARHFSIGPKGYVLFYVSTGAPGFAVQIGKSDQGPGPKSFDSRALQAGDLFAVTLVRPGTYSVKNTLSQGGRERGELELAYPPRVGKVAYQPPGPFRVQSGKTLEPLKIKLQAAQGLVFEVTATSRLVLDLQKANDGQRRSR
jgi:hypothetical protein